MTPTFLLRVFASSRETNFYFFFTRSREGAQRNEA